jgi:hypothetical protein
MKTDTHMLLHAWIESLWAVGASGLARALEG